MGRSKASIRHLRLGEQKIKHPSRPVIALEELKQALAASEGNPSVPAFELARLRRELEDLKSRTR